jgi:hypothetical protein
MFTFSVDSKAHKAVLIDRKMFLLFPQFETHDAENSKREINDEDSTGGKKLETRKGLGLGLGLQLQNDNFLMQHSFQNLMLLHAGNVGTLLKTITSSQI